MKRTAKLIGLTILLAVLISGAGLLVSRSVANQKADEIMRPAFSEGWVRARTVLTLWVRGEFKPSWFVEYDYVGTNAIIDFGPQFLISLGGDIIFMSPADLMERVEETKLRVEPCNQPDGGDTPSN